MDLKELFVLDNDIIRLIKPKIEELLLSFYNVEASFKKGFQNKKVGANSDNVIYYYSLPNSNIGLPKRDSFYDSGTQTMVYEETQTLESTFQFNSLVLKNPTITANDLLVYVRTIMLHLDFINHLKDNGLGVYKPTDIRNGWFETDNAGYEDNPSFDVTFQHELVTTSTTNEISQFDHIIERV
jgi:hypothetical protein